MGPRCFQHFVPRCLRALYRRSWWRTSCPSAPWHAPLNTRSNSWQALPRRFMASTFVRNAVDVCAACSLPCRWCSCGRTPPPYSVERETRRDMDNGSSSRLHKRKHDRSLYSRHSQPKFTNGSSVNCAFLPSAARTLRIRSHFLSCDVTKVDVQETSERAVQYRV